MEYTCKMFKLTQYCNILRVFTGLSENITARERLISWVYMMLETACSHVAPNSALMSPTDCVHRSWLFLASPQDFDIV